MLLVTILLPRLYLTPPTQVQGGVAHLENDLLIFLTVHFKVLPTYCSV